MRTVHRTLAVALPALTLCAGRLRAQTPNIRVAGRVQAQFTVTDGDSTSSYRPDLVATSGFEIRRLRVQADVRIGDNVNMVLQPSFEMSALRLRDAYVRVGLWRNPTSQVGLTLGQMKKPVSRYELTSSNTLPSIERGARFRGLVAGPGAVSAQNNLLEYNGYIAHDMGAVADANLAGGRAVVTAGLYNGSGESQADVNNAKSYGVRVVGTVLQDAEQRPLLRIGGSVFSRDRGVFRDSSRFTFYADSAHRSTVVGLDLEWGDHRPGFHLIADLATGENLDPAFSKVSGLPSGNRNFGNVVPNAPDSAFSTFASVNAVGSWRFQFEDPAGNRLVKAIEPALRVDVTDSDTDRGANRAVLVTPVISVHFSQTTILRAGMDFYRYYDRSGAANSITGARIQWQSNF
jgi:hypothetical protein